MNILQAAAVPVLVVFFAVTMVIGTISFVKAVVAQFRMIKHIKTEAYEIYPSLKWNPFNSIYYYGALEREGKKQRKLFLKNIFIFALLAISTVFLGEFVDGT